MADAQQTGTGRGRRVIMEALIVAIFVAILLEFVQQRYMGERMTYRLDLLEQHVEQLERELPAPHGAR